MVIIFICETLRCGIKSTCKQVSSMKKKERKQQSNPSLTIWITSTLPRSLSFRPSITNLEASITNCISMSIYSIMQCRAIVRKHLCTRKLCYTGELKLNPKECKKLQLQTMSASYILGSRKKVTRISKEILSLYSVLGRPHLEYCIHLQGPQNKKDVNLLERDTKLIIEFENLLYEDRLKDLGLFCLTKKLPGREIL